MIDAWLEPDDDFFDYEQNTSEEIDDDDETSTIDFDENLDRALRAIERAFFAKEGLLYG